MERWYAEACKQRSEAEEENFNLNKKRVFWKMKWRKRVERLRGDKRCWV